MLRLPLSLCCALALVGCATPPPPVASKDIDFRAELSRYGEWIIVAPYGRVWHPNAQQVGTSFAPYLTGGGWVYGTEGWTFASKWPWGKYTFRYGRWFQADDLGWLWWPDQTYGPAWVQWRYGDGHVGWSPTPPEVRAPRAAPPVWFYAKARFLSAREAEKWQLKPAELARVHALAEALPPAGPSADLVRAAGGMDRDPKVIEAPPPVVEPPAEEQPPEAPPPPPPKVKKTKKKRR